MGTELEDFINDNKDAFYSRTPDPAVLQRLQQQLSGVPEIKKTTAEAPVFSLRLKWVVAACLILMAGTVSFFALKENEAPQVAVVTPKQEVEKKTEEPTTIVPDNTTATVNEPETKAIQVSKTTDNVIDAALDREKNLLFAKLTNQGSAADRLEAASEVEAITKADNDIVDVLAKTMNTDPNTNVRLAALDALSKFYREPYVKKKLLSSLQQQKDPMVQIALIELLTKMKEASILKQLNKMVKDDNTIQPVKDQAYAGILHLRS